MRTRVADPEASNEAARFEAQKLAFAPLVFQAARVLRDTGLLERVYHVGAKGITARELAAANADAADATSATPPSLYAVQLLLEAGYAGGLLACASLHEEEPRFTITKAGVYWQKDALTRVNADFAHAVCYRPAFHLEESLRDGIPAGLRELGAFDAAATIYDVLAQLAPEVREAWFEFDHFYSDGMFDTSLDDVLAPPVRHIVDIGGNTGRFAEVCFARDATVNVTIVDLPPQVVTIEGRLASFVASGRLRTQASDVRAHDARLPAGADVYWLSQFLDCFGEEDVVTILRHVRSAMRPDSRVFIVETFWNEQRFEAARYCVIATSLYFACVANGRSRMYHSADMRRLVARAGLRVVRERHDIGLSHSLLECSRAPA